MLCEADELLSGPDCLIVAVGIYDDTRFETDVHRAAPNCEIVAFDGSLERNNLTHTVPKFLNLVPQYFDRKTHQRFLDRRKVNLLKLDCDTCEFGELPSWLDHVCTDQIVVEVHRRTYFSPFINMRNMHRLMTHFHTRGYRVAFLEPNPFYPKLGTEYTMVRNVSCGSQATIIGAAR